MFRSTSHFTPTADEQKALASQGTLTSALPKALFASTTAGWQGAIVEIKTGQLRSWWHDIDDVLTAIEDGSAVELDRAIGELERLKDTLDDLVRSGNASSSARADRDPR